MDQKKELVFTHARPEEAEEIMKVVLDAYIVEVGTTGIAFKTKNRYLSIDQVHEDIKKSIENGPDDKPEQVYFVARYSNDLSSPIVGCIRGVFLHDPKDGAFVCEAGPIAVDPKYQGQGLGSLIINHVEKYAVNERGVQFIQLTVVNWRTDVIPFYHKRGFVDVGEKPFRQPGHSLEDSCLSRESHFIIMRKPAVLKE